MLRIVLKRAFCVNNKDPIHVRNAQNDHYRALSKKFEERDDTQILGNFQKRFHDPQFIEQNEVFY